MKYLILGLALALSACGADSTPSTGGTPTNNGVELDAGTELDSGGSACAAPSSVCDGVCTNTQSDQQNCGACGVACESGEVCSAGTCALSCQATLSECEGTCIDTTRDPQNCGGCGVACESGEVCADSACAFTCQPGATDCDGLCTDTSRDLQNCGGCGVACESGEVCSDGTCAVSCQVGLSECGGLCTDTDRDRQNCGGCGVACESGEVCTSGACELSCQAGLVDCNGTCVDPNTDETYCGAGLDCTADPGTTCGAGFVCNGSGTCELSCQPGLVDCNGTCVDPNTDETYCGAGLDCAVDPGTTCGAGFVCNGAGTCELSCQPGLVDCNGTCVDPNTDQTYCGASADCAADPGTMCGAGFVCDGAGTCELSCQPGLVDCNGTCVDPNTDQTYCGAGPDCAATPGTTCGAGSVCNGAGTCELSCQAGLVDCNGTCVDPNTNPTYCGAGPDCAVDPGTTCAFGEGCDAGSCVPFLVVDGDTTFAYTGAPETFVVPAGVREIRIDALGAQGGTATSNNACSIGGLGGEAFGLLTVTPGETLTIYVGGAGEPGNVGGFNGGGVACPQTATCSRGGGASDVRQGGTTLADRVIVAGGGGGAEWSACTGSGGAGGGLVGGDGSSTSAGGTYNGRGGTQTAGGAAGLGSGGNVGTDGTLGLGGASGEYPNSGHAGSGGGGYYGGGGGGADGHGGGGSSYIGGVSSGSTTAGVQSGNGEVRLRWGSNIP